MVYFSLLLVTKSLPDPFLILGINTSPIFIDPLPVAVTVLCSVISDVLLVLLTVVSLAYNDDDDNSRHHPIFWSWALLVVARLVLLNRYSWITWKNCF